ncbi:MAG: hypothetical protein PVH41_04565 [Anaerolineae bacterium]
MDIPDIERFIVGQGEAPTVSDADTKHHAARRPMLGFDRLDRDSFSLPAQGTRPFRVARAGMTLHDGEH